jgi:hypothetical protein
VVNAERRAKNLRLSIVLTVDSAHEGRRARRTAGWRVLYIKAECSRCRQQKQEGTSFEGNLEVHEEHEKEDPPAPLTTTMLNLA